jgi:hypothetical protein
MRAEPGPVAALIKHARDGVMSPEGFAHNFLHGFEGEKSGRLFIVERYEAILRVFRCVSKKYGKAALAALDQETKDRGLVTVRKLLAEIEDVRGSLDRSERGLRSLEGAFAAPTMEGTTDASAGNGIDPEASADERKAVNAKLAADGFDIPGRGAQ